MSPPLSQRRRPIRLLAGLLLPLVAFVVLVQSLGDATEALAITDAIPLLWVLVYGVWRRRIEPVGLTAFGVFAVAVLLTIALGGSSLPLELHRAVFPGAVGLACLVSRAARRPLLAIASTKLAQGRAEGAAQTRSEAETPGAHRALAALTAIIGVTCVADAAAQIILAFTVSTSTFGELARVASYVIIGAGLAVCALYLRRFRASLEDGANYEPSRAHPRPQL